MSGPNECIAVCGAGRYRGRKTDGVEAYLGIRYAQPPERGGRFKPAISMKADCAPEIDAIDYGPTPVQSPFPRPDWMPRADVQELGEDCLNLNIWTPCSDHRSRPVLVHVFGGGFQGGSASGGHQDASALSAFGDCVVVRVNFRVGALGFLYLGESMGSDYEIGNVGLLDLIAALQWVKKNIAGFGGDPENVTLFGMSSGAFMIASLFGTSQARGLFHRVWMMSGSASRIIDRHTASALAFEFLRKTGVDAGNWEALAALPVDEILAAQSAICATDLAERNAPGGRTLGIVADGVTLERHPMEALTSGDWNHVAIVCGTAAQEARLWFKTGAMGSIASDEDAIAKLSLFDGQDASHIFRKLRDSSPTLDRNDLVEHFLTNAIYHRPADETVLAHVGAGGKGWRYMFEYVPDEPYAHLGAFHGIDEAFLFGAIDPEKVPYLSGSEKEKRLCRTLTRSLVGFARTGDPGWPAAEAMHMNTRRFGALPLSNRS